MSFNVIGLISGGKDSLFSLAHCVRNGHTVVALANLYPEDSQDHAHGDEKPDLDSFMFQTVGHSIVPLYAQALDLPLYRRAIQGKAHQTGRYYHCNMKVPEITNENSTKTDNTTIDETEDMYLLLADILKHHPEANAVSAGAIVSTYQRSRVESVAVRLGLTPLAYLWQYPALPPPSSRVDSITGLLNDMKSAGCDARIIKIASAGISNNLTFADVTDVRTQTRLLLGLAAFYSELGQEFALRGAVLGEGGEYETLALNGPSPLWKKRIEVKCNGEFEAEGGATYATFGNAVVVKTAENNGTELPIPSPLDKRFAMIHDQWPNLAQSTVQPRRSPGNSPTVTIGFNIKTTITQTCTTVHLCNLTAYNPNHPFDPQTQLTHIITSLASVLSSLPYPIALSNISATTLLLSTISSFTTLNAVYSQRLWPAGLPNPPARVTVAAPLPPGIDTSLSLVFTVPSTTNHDHLHSTGTKPTEPERKGLHVQSLSYWAPANIGPYSQAICSPIILPIPPSTSQSQFSTPLETVHMAGQIPLIPSSMQLLQGSFTEQAVLALQHLWRVGQERGVDLWVGGGVAYLARSTESTPRSDSGRERACIAAMIWKLAHEIDEKGRRRTLVGDLVTSNDSEPDDVEDEDFDVWNLQQNRGFTSSAAPAKLTVGEHLHILPNHDVFSRLERHIDRLRRMGLNTPDIALIQQRHIPTFIAAEVLELPRYAPIEWWSTGLAGLTSHAGREHSRVFSVRWRLENAWKLEGIMVEHHDLENGSTDDRDDDYRNDTTRDTLSTNGFTFFLSLLISTDAPLDAASDSKSIIATAPSTLTGVQTILFNSNDEDSTAWKGELVTAHSFVNLAAASDLRTAIEEMELVQNSTIVPCYQVWAPSLRDRTTEQNAPDHSSSATATTSQDEKQTRHDVNVEEVSVAVVLRIDVHPR